jgi:DNA-binding transcriptional LysR family regulator
VQGRGVVRMFSYHLAQEVADDKLHIILAGDEHPPLPVHLVSPHGRLSVPKVRAFVDFALPKLREAFEQRRLACDAPPEARSKLTRG